jgi:hypothetical protein
MELNHDLTLTIGPDFQRRDYIVTCTLHRYTAYAKVARENGQPNISSQCLRVESDATVDRPCEICIDTQTKGDSAIYARCAPSVRMRRADELSLVRRVIRALRKAGYEVSVDTRGEDINDVIQGNERALIDAVFSVDESYIIAHKDSGPCRWVRIALGNGLECIVDYTEGLTPIMEPIEEHVNRIEAGRV